jgi:hypothetical protein
LLYKIYKFTHNTKKRYLKIIANSAHKVYINEPYLFSDSKISIKSESINDALAFPCFCAKHDDRIFKEIENRGIDFENWRHLHLLCYRVELSERRKKEINIRYIEMVLDDPNLKCNVNRSILKRMIRGNRLGIGDSYKTIRDINNDLKSNEQITLFHYGKKLKHTGLCIAGVFNLETTADQISRVEITGYPYDYLSPIFIHLIPISQTEDYVIISYEKHMETRVKTYLNAFFEDSENDLLKQVSDLMFLQVENWVCSFDFYDKYIANRKALIESLISKTVTIKDENKSLDFNIFQN